ncbi:MAG: U32 family peptidase [Oscillospiraceae bacterium]|nr:U32 family peptidase [Oscillospiraceae bacterium]
MLELISPAGSPEGVIAAIQNGADAIYLGFKEFNAHTDAENFTFNEFGRALEYCRIRGIKSYLTLNSLATDNELSIIAHQAKEASRYGVDAIIVQDLGVMQAVKEAVPGMPLHASTRMCVHNLEGVKMAAAMGFSRVVVARELSRKKLMHICKYSPIEIEILIHGELCMSYSGQCYLSGLRGNHSANRGQCAKPCQLDYSTAGHTITYPLALKDNCLIRYLSDIESIGVTSVMIEGRTKRPEYSALVTGMYSRTTRSAKSPTHDNIRTLQKTFSRQGFTDGFYTERIDSEMLGVREEDKRSDTTFFAATRKGYLNGEFQRVPIRFVGSITKGKRIKIAAADDKNNSAVVYGPIPEEAFHRELTSTILKTQLHKTAGTPFICLGVKGTVEPGLTIPTSAFTEMRREVFAEILEQRKSIPVRAEGEYIPSGSPEEEFILDEYEPSRARPPVVTVSISNLGQLSEELEELRPKILYIPITKLDYESTRLKSILEKRDIIVAAILPRVIHDNERKQIAALLERAHEYGISDALIGNIGHIQFAKKYGMTVRGDFGLNVYNSETLFVLQKLGLRSATISFEMRLSEIRSLSKPMNTELMTYGRLPLMLAESCIVRNSTGVCTCDNFSGLVDENGAVYPVESVFGCRNVLLNSKKLFMADKNRAIASLGLWAQRLCFTTENAIECVSVMKRYMGLNEFTPPGYTRGMYFRSEGEI